MDILTFLLVGLMAGWLAGLIMKGRGFGVGWDIVIGMIGAVIGGLVFGAFGIRPDGFLGWILSAVVGALILLGLISLFKRGGIHGESL